MMMTVRRWQLGVAACGLVAGSVATIGQTQAAPRYQSTFNAPQATTPTLPKRDAITQNGTVVEDVVVRVNDEIITRSDLERSEAQLQQELQQNNASPSEREEKQKDLIRDMIDQQLLISKGKELGLNADAEVVRRLDEIRKQNHIDSMEDLEKAVRSQGLNYEDFKANIRNGLITQQVVRDEVGRRLQMTQGQEQAYYEAHKAEFTQPEQVRLSEILIPAPADATEAQLAQAKEKADGIAAKVKAGGSFEELAKANSGGQTAAQGGDLGEYKRGTLAKVLEDQTFALKTGESTEPIRTRQGYVILKVTNHVQAGVPPLKDVEQQVQEAMYMQQMAPALRAYLTRLREEAYIDPAPGIVDTAASPRQTKPVFTSYSLPQPKKKSHQVGRLGRGATTRPAATSTVAKNGLAPLPAGTGPAAVPDASGNLPAGAATTGTAVASGASATADTSNAAATSTSATTGRARASQRVSSTAKPKKIKREKVRYGQAPRNALPAGPEETAQAGSDTGAGAKSAAVTPGGVMEQSSGAASAPVENAAVTSNADTDPLAPKTAVATKSRFAARDKEIRAEKAAAKQAKVKEKTVATPAAPTQEETATQKTQAAPLGLNGDTAKKKKKVKVKGEAKERMQEKKPDTTAPAPVAPTVSPALTSAPGDTASAPPARSSDATTLPPASTPAPVGAPPQGQPLPATGTPQTTPNGTAAPQP